MKPDASKYVSKRVYSGKKPMSKETVAKRIESLGPAFQNTDDALPEKVMLAVLQCALSWEPEARLLGNVRACDIARAIRYYLEKEKS